MDFVHFLQFKTCFFYADACYRTQLKFFGQARVSRTYELSHKLGISRVPCFPTQLILPIFTLSAAEEWQHEGLFDGFPDGPILMR